MHHNGKGERGHRRRCTHYREGERNDPKLVAADFAKRADREGAVINCDDGAFIAGFMVFNGGQNICVICYICNVYSHVGTIAAIAILANSPLELTAFRFVLLPVRRRFACTHPQHLWSYPRRAAPSTRRRAGKSSAPMLPTYRYTGVHCTVPVQ